MAEVLLQLPSRTEQNLLVPVTEMQMLYHQGNAVTGGVNPRIIAAESPSEAVGFWPQGPGGWVVRKPTPEAVLLISQ